MCIPLLGEVGSLVSLLSSTIASAGGIMRVTSNLASNVGTGIIAITSAAAAAILATGREGTTPRGEGRTTTTLLSPPLITTRCKVGLHPSYKGDGAMLNPDSIWPLSKKYRSVTPQKLNNEIEKSKESIPGRKR